MKTINIQPVVKQWIDNNLPTVYAEGSSWYEVLLILTRKVDEMISQINNYFDKDLTQVTESILTEWKSNGELETLINDVLFQTKADKATVDNIAIQVLSSGSDDTAAIQTSIDNVASKGGGTVLLPSNNYIYSTDIHIKERVLLKGNDNTTLTCEATSNARIIPYDRSGMSNLTFDIPSYYNDSVIYFSNQFAMRSDKPTDKTRQDLDIYISKININSVFNSAAPNKTAVELFATRSTEVSALRAGYWGITMQDCKFYGVTRGFYVHTILSGWINANKFHNITLWKFKNAVVVEKSADSLGIDWNEFNLIIQTSTETEDIFVDADSSNNYIGCQIWDMPTYPNAKVGSTGDNALKNNINRNAVPKERYTNYLSPNYYYLIGRFKNFTTIASHVAISMKAAVNVDTEFLITGNNERVEITINGSHKYLKQIEFYKNTLPDGTVEIYIYNNSPDTYIYANFFIESFYSFYPSTYVRYATLPTGAVRLTNEQQYSPGMSSGGDNSSGRWIQYNDGTLIQHITLTNVPAATVTSSGNLYISGTAGVWTFPKPFMSRFSTSVSISSTSPDRIPSIRNLQASSCSFGFISGVTGETNVDVTIQAIGRWKP